MDALPYIRNISLSSLSFVYRESYKGISSCREGYPVEKEQSARRISRPEIPIWNRSSLTIDEAAEYSGVGRSRLRQLTSREDCPFVLWVGGKRLIRREKLDQYLDKVFSI